MNEPRLLPGSTVVTPEMPETSKAAALAWNAYYKGRSMAVLRTAAAFRLEGTRWNK